MLEVKRYADRADIFIDGEIDDEMARRLKDELNAIGDSLPLSIYINSGGGSVFSGVSMANMIARHKGQTTSINNGLCASIATQIFFTADHCKAPENCFFLLHPPSTESAGNAADMRQAADTLETIARGLQSTYRRKARAGVNNEKIAEMMSRETWLTASEAAELFDIEVVEPLKAINRAVFNKFLKRNDNVMKRSDELKLEIADRQMQLDAYKNASDTKNFYKTTNEIQALMTECQRALEHEHNQLCSFLQSASPIAATNAADNQTLRNRAFNKLLFSRAKGEPPHLTDAEKSSYFNVSGSPGSPGQIEMVPERGGYLVSQDQMKQLQEFRSAYTALKPYCTVINAASNHGRWPTLPDQAIEFEPLVEMSDISEGEIHFSEAEYTIADYGLIIPCSNQLLQDADVDLIGVIGKTLAKGAVRTENKKILSKILPFFNDSANPVETITNHKALNSALYKKLDAVYEPTAKIFCNQDSFIWLSNLDDGQGRPLLVPDVTAPNKYSYRGKEIVVLPNAVFDSWTTNAATYAPLILGDLSSLLFFFERQGLELTTSDQYLWRKNAFAVRAIMRFDCVVADPNAVVCLQIRL